MKNVGGKRGDKNIILFLKIIKTAKKLQHSIEAFSLVPLFRLISYFCNESLQKSY